MTDPTVAEFCERLRGRLVGSLTLFCGDRAVAEELAQEALARAWERWSSVGQMASPEAWTYRTALNLARSRFRRRAAERRANRRHSGRFASSGNDEGSDAAASLAIRAAVAGLPPRQRAVIVARFYLGLDVADTATALDCAQGTVKAATHAAIQNLRAAGLADEHEHASEVDRT
jgi:RNA polymerase sigma factor (sigma-70 family)